MVKKAVIPAAGLGIRFLPATKAQPKEMLPIIDKPTIQYVVEEAVDSGIEDILIIIGKGKRAIEDHFDRNIELELLLQNKDTMNLYNDIRRIGDMANIHFIRQKELNGLGDAISYAKQHIGEEPFAVLLGDTLIDSVIPVTQQLIDLYEQYRQSLIAIEPVPKDRVGRYGIISGNKISEKIWQVAEIVEKPRVDRSPSNLAIAGRYILTPDIFKAIEQTEPDKFKNIELTNALNILITRQNIFAYIIEGNRYALDDKFDFLKMTVDLALKRKEFSSSFRKYLEERLK